jgi:hypothetical protein
MTRLGWLVFGTFILLLAGVTSFFFFQPPPAPVPVVEETPTENLEGQSIYASGEYGFTVRYPAKAKIEETFSTFYHLGSYWRANALPQATGTPLLAVISYETKSENSFPRYFNALVRIGVSDDVAEIKNCEKVTPDQGETALADVVLNGTTWKAFSFQNAGMQQYVKGISYRVIHDGKCFALEKIAVGSSYQDDPDSPDDIPQATLDAAYEALDPIIQTFAFTAP